MHDFNRDEAGDKAFYMRKANPEQFYVLVRMHLSFEFDGTTEEYVFLKIINPITQLIAN